MVVKSSIRSSLLVDHGSYPSNVSIIFSAAQLEPRFRKTHVANIDYITSLSTSSSMVSEGVRGDGGIALGTTAETRTARTARTTGTTGTTGTASKAASATTIAKSTAMPTEASTAETAAKASTHTTTVASTTTKAAALAIGETILANLEDSPLPVVAVELLDRVSGIFSILKDNDTRPLGTAVGAHVNISANDASDASYEESAMEQCRLGSIALTSLSEKVLHILPTNVEGELGDVSLNA